VHAAPVLHGRNCGEKADGMNFPVVYSALAGWLRWRGDMSSCTSRVLSRSVARQSGSGWVGVLRQVHDCSMSQLLRAWRPEAQLPTR
jgi:hypothetical protein